MENLLTYLASFASIIAAITSCSSCYIIYSQRIKTKFTIYYHTEEDFPTKHSIIYCIKCYSTNLAFNIVNIEIRYNNKVIVGCLEIDNDNIDNRSFTHIFPMNEDNFLTLKDYFNNYKMKYFDIYTYDVFGKSKIYKLPTLDVFNITTGGIDA